MAAAAAAAAVALAVAVAVVVTEVVSVEGLVAEALAFNISA